MTVMTQDQCIEAISNYWDHILPDKQEGIQEHLLNIWELSQEYRKAVALNSSNYYQKEAQRLSVKLLHEHDELITLCESIWGEDGP